MKCLRRVISIAFAAGLLLAFARAGFASHGVIDPNVEKSFDKFITLDLRNMDVVDVFKFFSVKGRLSIVVSKNVQGRVSLVLREVRLKDALDIICIANGLGYQIRNNIVYVMPEEEYVQMYGKLFRDKTKVKMVFLKYAKPSYVLEALRNVKSEIGRIVIDEDSGSVIMIDTEEKLVEMEALIIKMDHKLETKIFNLNYAKAETIKEQLRERLDVKSVGSIQADERSNQVVVTALPNRFEEVEKIIQALDRRIREVLIKVKILKIVLNPSIDEGIDWEQVFSRIGIVQPSATLAQPFADLWSRTQGANAHLAVGSTLGSSTNLTVAISALKQISDSKVLANPEILVTENQEAKIHIGDNLAYVTTTSTGTGADRVDTEEVHFVAVGIILKVKPSIADDGFVNIALSPEISSQTGTLETSAGAKIPLINTTTVETNILVKDSTTVVIGGLRRNEGTKKRKGVSGLMNAPLVGRFFNKVVDTKTNTEIVIFLTPHVVTGDENLIESYLPQLKELKSY